MDIFKAIFLAILTASVFSCSGLERVEYKQGSEKEVRAFVENLLDSVNQRNGEALNKVFDLAEISARAFEGIKSSETERLAFFTGLERDFDYGTSLASGETLKKVSLMKLSEEKDYHLALIRSLYGEGVNYHEWKIAKEKKKGRLRILNSFEYGQGQWLSDNYRRVILQSYADEKKTKAPDSHINWTYEQILMHIYEMETALQAQNPSRVLEMYDQLPQEGKSEQLALVYRIYAADMISDSLRREAVKDYEEKFPENPGLDLMLMDKDFLVGNYQGAIDRINTLFDKMGIEDPYLIAYKSNAYMLMGKSTIADSLADVALDLESDLEDPLWVKLSLSVEKEDLKQALNYAQLLVLNFGYQPTIFIRVPELAPLVESDEYKRWAGFLPN